MIQTAWFLYLLWGNHKELDCELHAINNCSCSWSMFPLSMVHLGSYFTGIGLFAFSCEYTPCKLIFLLLHSCETGNGILYLLVTFDWHIYQLCPIHPCFFYHSTYPRMYHRAVSWTTRSLSQRVFMMRIDPASSTMSDNMFILCWTSTIDCAS